MWQTNLKVTAVAIVVVAFYTAIAHIIPQLQSAVPESIELGADVTPEALVAAGEQVYNGAGGCTACHGTGTRAPNLLTDHAGQGLIGARCGTRVAGQDCKAYLFESLTDPSAHLVPGFNNIMQDARRTIPMDQTWAVIAYLQSQGGEVTVTAQDIRASQEEPAAASAAPAFSATLDPLELINEHACLACHQLEGQGTPVGPPFDGMGSRITADRIRRGIVDPGAEAAQGYEPLLGAMPTNLGTKLSASQLEALVQFLASQR